MRYSIECAEKLIEIESFVQGDSFQTLRDSIVAEDDMFIGAYINDPDNFIFLTMNGLHWVSENKILWVPYEAIRSVELPDDEDSARELMLELDGKEHIKLPILNETAEYPDIYVFQRYLLSVVYWPHSGELERVKYVCSRANLAFFLSENGSLKHERAIRALNWNLPKPWQMEQIGVDPALLENPQVWRLLAYFMCQEFNDQS